MSFDAPFLGPAQLVEELLIFCAGLKLELVA